VLPPRRKEPDKNIRHGRAQGAQQLGARAAATIRAAERLEPVAEPRKEWELRQLAWGDRMLVRGANGSGKTTLLQAMLGRIPLSSGRSSLGPSVRIGEINQARKTFEPETALLDAFGAETGLLPAAARTLLAKFGLGADDVERPIASLPPGERTRTGLALLMYSGQISSSSTSRLVTSICRRSSSWSWRWTGTTGPC
jgi:ATPase subunit of ABC transporter with duplicated ATPase domains